MTAVMSGGIDAPWRPDPRHRLHALLDPGTVELGVQTADAGVRTARGRVAGAPVVAFAFDPAVQGGAMGEQDCERIVAAYDEALACGRPVIGLWHSGGARLGEGVVSLDAVGQVFAAMTRVSGRIPQLSVVLGPAAGGAAYGPALTDLVVLAPQARVFVTGPSVVRSVTGEQVDADTLGGPKVHGDRSGLAHLIAPSEQAAITAARRLTSLVGMQRTVHSAHVADRDLGAYLPESPRRAYDVRPLVDAVLDGPAVELQPRWAPNMVTAMGRIGGRTVGVLANNPIRLGGCLDSCSAEKAARFVRMCDAFGIPLVVLVDVPGYLPGTRQEWDGVVRRGAKLLHAFAAAAVPRVTLLTRKAYGGAYIAMNSRSLGASRVFAWPAAEVAVMGAVVAVRILHGKTLAALPAEKREAAERDLAAAHEASLGGLAGVVKAGVVDEVIEPRETRSKIAEVLAGALPARGAHGNIPL
jgi:acetyl-CoA/propionyl-CoA carboxylase carboxyl transferase subunit